VTMAAFGPLADCLLLAAMPGIADVAAGSVANDR